MPHRAGLPPAGLYLIASADLTPGMQPVRRRAAGSGHARYGRARKAACAEFRTENAPGGFRGHHFVRVPPAAFYRPGMRQQNAIVSQSRPAAPPATCTFLQPPGRPATARHSAARDRCGRLLCARQRRSQGASSKSRLGFTWGNSHDRRPGRPDFLIAAGEVRGAGGSSAVPGLWLPARQSRGGAGAQTGGGRADNASTPRAQGVQRSRRCAR